MKNIIKSSVFFGISIVLAASCDPLHQEAMSSFESPAVYSYYELARLGVNGIYESYVNTYAYRDDYFYYHGGNTDVEIFTNTGTDEKSSICKYQVSPTNSYLNRSGDAYFYPGNFIGIARANEAIQGLRKYGNVDKDADMSALLGEALTARALLYVDLLNTYGDVPARFEPIEPGAEYLPKSDRDVIYRQLLADLEEAASRMEYSSQTTITFPGKACANGLYARVALQASGYSLRPDEGKVGTGDPGTIRLSNDPQLSAEVLLPKALKALEDVIKSGKFSLFDKYEDLWRFYCNLETAADKEIIFGLPMSDTRGQHIALNGVPNTKYNFNTPSGRNGIVPSLFFKFDPGDTRRDVTCVPAGYGDDGLVNLSKFKSGCHYCGKWRFDWMEAHPYKTKNAEDGAKYTYLRYADILLMAAEIANELNDLELAKSYMRPVLDRAFHDNAKVDGILNGLADKETFFTELKQQRAFEFAGENIRKTDLIRWGCLKSTLDSEKEFLQSMRNHTGQFADIEDFIYYRYKPGTKTPEIEIKALKTGEAAPPASEGWIIKDKYFSAMDTKVYTNMYLENPDQKMYRPIPAAIITANLGHLVNDYGYNN